MKLQLMLFCETEDCRICKKGCGDRISHLAGGNTSRE